MSRTHNQQMADAHEQDIAEWIGGVQHKGSGNQWSRQMDVSNGEKLVPFPLAADGKATLGKSISVTRDMWLKAVAQTFNKIPTIWLRFYKDESLREVSTDLVVIERREFLEILEAARTHKTLENQLMELAMKGETFSIMAAEEERHPLLTAELPAKGHCGGCDCCR